MTSLAAMPDSESTSTNSSTTQTNQPSDTFQSVQHEEFSSKPNVPPRKRSKVSRACDACRKKKVRCDAEFSPSSNSVTKTCTNCVKINEICSFSRVPLKRGPSKGYIRDLEEKIEYSQKHNPNSIHNPTQELISHNHRNSLDLSNPPLPHFSYNQPNLNTMNQLKPQIILPPLNSLRGSFSNGLRPNNQIQHTLNNNGSSNSINSNQNSSSNPSSPKASSYMNNVLNHPSQQQVKNQQAQHIHSVSQQINTQQPSIQQFQQSSTTGTQSTILKQPEILPQGHFWKVPYELPFNRRGSVDSISSSISEVSNSKFPNLATTISNNSSNIHPAYDSSVISDSDDDYHSASQRRFSQSLSPRNSITSNNAGRIPTSPALSISSLSSLNGKIIKNLNIQNTVPQINQQPIMQPLAPGMVKQGHSSKPSISMSNQAIHESIHQSIESNLNYYYSIFHRSFPILPFNDKFIITMIDQLVLDDQTKVILDIFNLSLQCLKNYDKKSISDCIFIFNKMLSIYPFEKFGIKLNDNLLVLFLSSIVLINYSILLNGELYSIGNSLIFTVLNDFKILEGFMNYIRSIEMKKQENSMNNPDDIKAYLPKLYLSSMIIDNVYSITFGSGNHFNTIRSNAIFNKYLTYLIPLNSDTLVGLNNFKVGLILKEFINQRNAVKFRDTKYKISWNDCDIGNISGLSGLFISIMKEKNELYEFIKELKSHFLTSGTINSTINEEEEDLIQDYRLKLCRMSKKITSSIINILNNLSGLVQQQSSEGIIISPLINLIYGQTYRLILTLKLIIDSLNMDQTNGDLVFRCNKISTDLSTSNNLIKLIKLPISNNIMDIIRQKQKNLNLDLNFQISPNHTGNPKVSKIKSMNNWRKSIMDEISPIIENEDYEGWI